jgi:hypothetical protein
MGEKKEQGKLKNKCSRGKNAIKRRRLGLNAGGD